MTEVEPAVDAELEAQSEHSPCDEQTRPAHPVWQWLTGDPTVRRSTVAAWVLLAALSIAAIGSILAWDHTDHPLTADEPSYLLPALSLAGDGHNLSYDPSDGSAWRDLGVQSMPNVYGVFFRTSDEGYMIGKPYGYPLYLSPFIAVFGFGTGLSIANSMLLATLIGLGLAILRTRYRGPTVPLLCAAFVFASPIYLYAYAVSVELFFATLVAAVTLGHVRWWATRRWRWAAFAFVVTGLVAAEKPPLALVLLVPALVTMWSSPDWRRRVLGPVLVGCALVAAVSPYLYYSGGDSYTPYATPRYYAKTDVFSNVPIGQFLEAVADPERVEEVRTLVGTVPSTPFDPGDFVDRVTAAPEEVPKSLFHYVTGRHTGLMVWTPLALFALVAALGRLRRLDWMARALLGAVLAYIGLYVVAFTDNYFGGGHSLGNRYFLQASPLVLGLLAHLGWSVRRASVMAGSALAISALLLFQHHLDPHRAYLEIDRTSPIQRLFPFETSQAPTSEFRCTAAYGYAFPCTFETP